MGVDIRQYLGGGQPRMDEYLATASWTVPAGVYVLYITGCGAGGGGGGGASGITGTSASGGAAGQGGTYVHRFAIPVQPGDTIDITIGNGGNGGVARTTYGNGLAGANGDTTTVEVNSVVKLRLIGGVGGGGGVELGNSTGGNNDLFFPPATNYGPMVPGLNAIGCADGNDGVFGQSNGFHNGGFAGSESANRGGGGGAAAGWFADGPNGSDGESGSSTVGNDGGDAAANSGAGGAGAGSCRNVNGGRGGNGGSGRIQIEYVQ